MWLLYVSSLFILLDSAALDKHILAHMLICLVAFSVFFWIIFLVVALRLTIYSLTSQNIFQMFTNLIPVKYRNIIPT